MRGDDGMGVQHETRVMKGMKLRLVIIGITKKNHHCLGEKNEQKKRLQLYWEKLGKWDMCSRYRLNILIEYSSWLNF
jgi:hypothetical protein